MRKKQALIHEQAIFSHIVSFVNNLQYKHLSISITLDKKNQDSIFILNI